MCTNDHETSVGKKKRDMEFVVNDLVWLCLTLYRQSTVAKRSKALKYFSPFRVQKRVG